MKPIQKKKSTGTMVLAFLSPAILFGAVIGAVKLLGGTPKSKST
jgi:hypothetical protein